VKTEEVVRVKLSNVLPNPYRDFKRYHVDKQKVQALKESIDATGFWCNVIVRPSPTERGKVELAYGHHRLVALREINKGKPGALIPVVRLDLDDAAMLRMMHRENMDSWKSYFWAEIETVQEVVRAYARGEIELPAPSKDTPKSNIRYAPSFAKGRAARRADRPYTAQTICAFLGVTKRGDTDRIKLALQALELEELDYLPITEMRGLGVEAFQAAVGAATARYNHAVNAERKVEALKQQNAPAAEIKQSEKRAEKIAAETKEGSQDFAIEMTDALRESTKTTVAQAKEKAKKATKGRGEPPPRIPDINSFVRKVGNALEKVLVEDIASKHLEALYQHRKYLDETRHGELVGSLRALADRANKWAGKFEKVSPKSTEEVQRLLKAL
jgi:hypothetical protein